MTALEALNTARQAGLTSACLHPLLALVEDSPLTPSEIANRCCMSTANIAGLIDRLEKNGWITIRRHDKDRRSRLIVPTEKAFNLLTPALDKA